MTPEKAKARVTHQSTIADMMTEDSEEVVVDAADMETTNGVTMEEATEGAADMTVMVVIAEATEDAVGLIVTGEVETSEVAAVVALIAAAMDVTMMEEATEVAAAMIGVTIAAAVAVAMNAETIVVVADMTSPATVTGMIAEAMTGVVVTIAVAAVAMAAWTTGLPFASTRATLMIATGAIAIVPETAMIDVTVTGATTEGRPPARIGPGIATKGVSISLARTVMTVARRLAGMMIATVVVMGSPGAASVATEALREIATWSVTHATAYVQDSRTREMSRRERLPGTRVTCVQNYKA